MHPVTLPTTSTVRRARPRRLLGASVLLGIGLAACQRTAPPPPPPPPEAPRDAAVAVAPPTPADTPKEPVYRTETTPDPVVPALLGTGKTFLVVSEAAQATEVGRQVLATGGNAVDAAVATAFALAVVHPSAGNLGGGGFAVVRVAKGKAVALDFRETAPAAATDTMFLDEKGNPTLDSRVGHRASGVPGSVAGLYELHRKLGKKPWKDLVEPAIRLAREGFVIDEHTAKGIARRAELLLKYPKSAEIWVPDRTPRAAGDTVSIPLLALALERIRDQGPAGFYQGPTAQAIVDEMKAGGGLITAEDLAGYRAVWREPLRFSYRGTSVISMPPPSSGGIVLAMTAGMLRKTELGKLPWHGYEHVHWLVETWRRAFAARNELLGDPAFVNDMPLTTLLSTAYLDKLAATIGPGATPSTDVKALLEGDHTTNLSVVDPNGMAVALTTTLNTAFGSGVTVHGFLLNNEMDDFAVKPGTPNVFGLVQWSRNRIEPGKRMLSSMTPTIVEDRTGEVALVVGAQGGPRIISAVWQTLSNVIDFGYPVGTAVALPRIHHQHRPDLVLVEASSITRETADELRAAGYTLDFGSPFFGAANAIARTKAGWAGAGDPRSGGAAMGD